MINLIHRCGICMKIINKIIEYGIYLLVLILPFQTRLILVSGQTGSGALEYERISLYASDILIIVLFILYLFSFLKGKKKIEKIPAHWWAIACLDIFLFSSIFFASDRILAGYHYFIFLLGVFLFLLIMRVGYDKLTFYIFLVFSLLIQAALGIFQFLYQGSPASKWLGMAEHLPAQAGTSVIETFSANGIGERWLRAYGGLDHPNMFGAFLVVGLLFSLCLILGTKLRPKTLELNFCLASSIVVALALIFSFSRSSWIALAFGIILLLAFFTFSHDRLRQVKILGFVFIFSLVAFVPLFFYNNLFQTRVSAIGRLEEKSLNERGRFLAEGRETIKDNFFFGVGIGNYIKEQTDQRPDDDFWTFEPVHNTFLLIWAEIGIFGLLAFFFFLSVIFVKSLKKKNIGNLSILVSLVIMMLFDHLWWSLHFGILLFWFITALLIRNLNDKKYERF